jgi:gamma-glutamyltranspeptidase
MGQTVFFIRTDQLGPAASTTTRINLVFRAVGSSLLHPKTGNQTINDDFDGFRDQMKIVVWKKPNKGNPD